MHDSHDSGLIAASVSDDRLPVSGTPRISLRRYPYPYRAALAICSDIDETQTTEEFLEIQRFLNTKQQTSMGEGVGLEIGNSFYFYDDEKHFSYFTHDERARPIIIDLIKAGYLDCLHSYGDAVATRDQVLRALDELHRADCRLDVWVNHYGSRSDFSRKFEYMFVACHGDDPKSDVYHADVTLAYGIRFAWVGATTRAIGQALDPAPPPLSTVFDPRHPLRSSLSVVKELRKLSLGTMGDERFAIHSQNRLLGVLQLADGQQVHEFMRYCNHPVSVGEGATSHGLGYVISKRALRLLKNSRGLMIVYTHLGKRNRSGPLIAGNTQAALRHLEHDYRTGEIYVTTTSKLLNYCRAYQYLAWSHQESEGRITITIDHLDDPLFGRSHPTVSELQGLTFYVPDRIRIDVAVRGVGVEGLQRNPADESGMESVTIPFTHLSFPC
jgi:hypothetical protein